MNLKKVKVINVILLFVISFLWHFIYEWCPNVFTSIFFPVNESIMEHMKIIFGAFVVIGFVSNFMYKKYDIHINNRWLEVFIKGLLGIIFYLVIFLPIYKLIGENMIFSIGLMFVTYLVMEILGYFILNSKELNLGWLSILLIVAIYVVFGYLTYKPIHNFVFYDENYKEYGILSKNK